MGGTCEKPISTTPRATSTAPKAIGTTGGKGRIHNDSKTGMVHIHDDTTKLRCAVEPAAFARFVDWIQTPAAPLIFYDTADAKNRGGTRAVITLTDGLTGAGSNLDIAISVEQINVGDNLKAFLEHAKGQ